MRQGIVRGLLIGAISAVVIALYQWLRYRPDTTTELFSRISNGEFSIGLLYLIFGVVTVTRLFSFRRRMGLQNYVAMIKHKTREEYLEHVKSDEELNERDKVVMQERGRDITYLVSAVFLMAVSVVLTLNQVK